MCSTNTIIIIPFICPSEAKRRGNAETGCYRHSRSRNNLTDANGLDDRRQMNI